jgi:hypothetical protein
MAAERAWWGEVLDECLQRCEKFAPRSEADRFILVCIERQRLALIEKTDAVFDLPCSTSAKPPSCHYGSEGTPTGLHEIAEKIGAGQPAGSVFQRREPTGSLYSEIQDDAGSGNLICSRILWLRGREPDHNEGYSCGSWNRKIYIHGTNHEEQIGTPFSGGCILLRNTDVIDLFDRVHQGDLVYLHEKAAPVSGGGC